MTETCSRSLYLNMYKNKSCEQLIVYYFFMLWLNIMPSPAG